MTDYRFFGHGYPPEAVKRAEQVYISAWQWRANNHELWRLLIEAANAKAASGQRICVREIFAGAAPQRFAAIIARWLKLEQPQLLPYIETRRSAYDLFIGG